MIERLAEAAELRVYFEERSQSPVFVEA